MKSYNLVIFVAVLDFKLHSLNADISRSQIRLLKADSRAQGGDSKPENEICCRLSQSEQSKSASKSRLHEHIYIYIYQPQTLVSKSGRSVLKFDNYVALQFCSAGFFLC